MKSHTVIRMPVISAWLMSPNISEAYERGGGIHSTLRRISITLQVNTNPTIDIALKVGNVSEQVQVEANAALVETQATGIGTVIENRRILELPLNGPRGHRSDSIGRRWSSEPCDQAK